jgi:4-hydroxy-tetrahydrodipicolinate synthase
VLQHAPSQTGAVLSAEELVALARAHPNLSTVKVESHPPGRMVEHLLRLSGGALRSLVGYAGLQWPDAHARGAVGVQPGSSVPELYVEMQELLDAGAVDAFQGMHQRALPWLAYWMQSVELLVSVEKLILQRRGVIASARCRRPSYALDRLEMAAIDSFLTEFDELLQ